MGPRIDGPELRVYLLVEELQRQFAAYLGTPTRARGYPPFEGQHSLIIEVAPGLAIERVIDLALKSSPDKSVVQRAGEAILDGIGAAAADQLRPRTLYSDIIEDITDQHAIILNRNRQASMVMPGQTLLVYEMTPALFATVAANEAEKVAPDLTLVDVQMIGAAGRVYMSGSRDSIVRAREAIAATLEAVVGREH